MSLSYMSRQIFRKLLQKFSQSCPSANHVFSVWIPLYVRALTCDTKPCTAYRTYTKRGAKLGLIIANYRTDFLHGKNQFWYWNSGMHMRGYTYYTSTEAEFIIVQFRWGSWALSWEFSDLRFQFTMFTLQTSSSHLCSGGGGREKIH